MKKRSVEHPKRYKLNYDYNIHDTRVQEKIMFSPEGKFKLTYKGYDIILQNINAQYCNWIIFHTERGSFWWLSLTPKLRPSVSHLENCLKTSSTRQKAVNSSLKHRVDQTHWSNNKVQVHNQCRLTCVMWSCVCFNLSYRKGEGKLISS